MNLKNFPKRLDSKTSCLRITVPENLDLALEGLIRKVLREQPKVDDIYAFAADYFDMLLKIRDKVGTKFAADQLCPFHNDEDAHDMIKLASNFAKPGILKTKSPETEKTKNDIKPRTKDSVKSARKLGKAVESAKPPVIIRPITERLPEKKKVQRINETKLERPKTLKLEPKTVDVDEDEEFLKSDQIKALVEKEFMDATESREKYKQKEGEEKVQQNDSLQRATANEALHTEIEQNRKQFEEKKPEATDGKIKHEETDLRNVVEEAKVKEENGGNAMEETEAKFQDVETNTAPSEAVTQGVDSVTDTSIEKIKEELPDDAKDEHGEANAVIQRKDLENKTENNHSDEVENLSAEKEVQKSFENESKKDDAKSEDVTDSEINQETLKEIIEGQVKEQNTEPESSRKYEKEEQIKTEAADALTREITEEPSTAEQVIVNPDELCTVVDMLSIKPLEKEERQAKEPEYSRESGTKETKIETEEAPPQNEKEDAQIQKSMKGVENITEPTLANTGDENVVIIPSENEDKQKRENLTTQQANDIDELPHTLNSVEKLSRQAKLGENEFDVETGAKEEKIKKTDSVDIKPVSFEDEKSAEDKIQTGKAITNDTFAEEKLKTTLENAAKDIVTTAEEQLIPQEKPSNASENKEDPSVPEKVEAATASETQTKNENIKLEESFAVEGERGKRIENETEGQESNQNLEKTENNENDLKLEEVDSAVQEAREETSNAEEERAKTINVTEQPEGEKTFENEEVMPEEDKKNVKEEAAMDIAEKKEDNTKAKDVYKKDIGEDADRKSETLSKGSEKKELLNAHGPIEPADDSKESAAETSAIKLEDLSETNKKPEEITEKVEPQQLVPGDESPVVTDSQCVIKVEESETLPEEAPHLEGVQIKTIQTHYYDNLQVPEQITKEYRVRAVENGSGSGNLEAIPNSVVVPSDERRAKKIPAAFIDLSPQENQESDKTNMEDSLMMLSSSLPLNLSELSVQTITELFLDREKQYTAPYGEHRKYVTKPGDKCGNETDKEKHEVEETIHKIVIPYTTGATPVAPRDEVRINEKENVEAGVENEKKGHAMVDLNKAAVSSDEGRSVDSSSPIISVEVNTMIKTQTLEDEEKERDGGEQMREDESDIQIRIETTIDVPEGVVVHVREEKDSKDEVRHRANNEPSTSETIPKDSQTSSGESESTASSAATEIKRIDSSKRHFSSTRTLITTQSLELDKRNPLLKTRSLSSFRQGVTDFEVWSAIEKELEEAATKIQSNFRGYKTRKKLQRENAVQITTEESSCSTTPVEPEPREERQQSTGEFHDSIVLSEHPR